MMKVSSSPNREKLPPEVRIEGELMRKNKEHQKKEGEAVLKLIDAANVDQLVNKPLASGDIGTKINIAV